MINHISLDYFDTYHSGHCGYCGKNNSVSIGINAELFEPDTYEKLMNKGWRRCGTYYYKFDFKTTCCLAYTIRANALQNQQKKSHRKIAKRLLNILKDDSLKIKQPNLLKQFQLIEDSNQNKQQKKYQKQQKQQKQQICQVENLKQTIKIEIDIGILENIKEDLTKQLQFIQQNKQLFSEQFQKFMIKKGYDLNIFAEVLKLDLNINNIKIFQSQNLEKGDYYSNFIQCLYGLNKKTLFLDYSIQDFALDIAEFVRLNFQSDKYHYVLETTGYLSIFHLENQDRLQKHIQQVNKKQTNLQKETVGEIPNQPKQNIEIINKEGFLANTFFIGNMKIVLKKAQCTEESFLIYKKYCFEIHEKSKESKGAYSSFLCEQGLKCSILKSNIDPTKLLFIGSYHMNYYLGDRLIAVGVVDITPQVLSSVYFFYDPEFEDYNLGTFGALVEIEYVKILNQYFPNFQWYYLGFYIQHSQKMVYKGEYQPAQLLCPLTYNWVILDESLKNEIAKRQAQTIRQQLNISEQPIINDLVKGVNDYNNVQIYVQGKQMKLNSINPDFVKQLQKYFDVAFSVLGRELMNIIIFDL